MNAQTPNQIEPFKLGHGRPLSAMVQEMIAKEMMRGIHKAQRPQPMPTSVDVPDRGKARRDEMRDEVVRLYQEGVAVSTISLRMNAAADTIKKTLREAGIEPQMKPVTWTRADELRPEILRMRREGASIRAIRQALHSDDRLIKRVLAEAGL